MVVALENINYINILFIIAKNKYIFIIDNIFTNLKISIISIYVHIKQSKEFIERHLFNVLGSFSTFFPFF